MKRKTISAALGFTFMSTVFAANMSPMTYAQMTQLIGAIGSSDLKISKEFIGKDIILNLRKAGEKTYAVRASDMVLFLCDSAETGYKGGKTKGKITKFESSPDGLMIFSLNRCGN